MSLSALQARLAGVRERIARAADRTRRDPSLIRLIAVSKTFDEADVREAADFDQHDFGENKVQEALQKIDATRDLQLRWHLIGHLQTNKARKAAGAFDVVHSVDGVPIADRLDQAALAAGRHIELLIQVDLAGEAAKHGAREDEVFSIVEAAKAWRSSRLTGLMLLPPAVDSPEEARPYFCALRSLRDRLVDRGVASSMVSELSMGMSHDFEVAVEEGATLLRVGTAIFGTRPARLPA